MKRGLQAPFSTIHWQVGAAKALVSGSERIARRFAKVRVAGSNPVVRSLSRIPCAARDPFRFGDLAGLSMLLAVRMGSMKGG